MVGGADVDPPLLHERVNSGLCFGQGYLSHGEVDVALVDALGRARKPRGPFQISHGWIHPTREEAMQTSREFLGGRTKCG